MESLVVDCEVRSEAVVVSAKGEVDSNTAEQLVTQLNAALRQAATHAERLLIIDLDELAYFGSAGLNAVLECHQQGLEAGTPVRLIASNRIVVNPIEVTKLDKTLALYRTYPDALQGHGDP
jgi:anti-anti-sigma factor